MKIISDQWHSQSVCKICLGVSYYKQTHEGTCYALRNKDDLQSLKYWWIFYV